MSDNKPGATHEFKAEIRQLLEIITHSIYTNREIFLRELVSNASDALDKLRFETGRGAAVADPELPLEIRITADKEAGVLTIADTGLGMTRDELVENIGTIARSGSAEFIKQLTHDKDAASGIIGRFGVGFYSVFMVAKKVVLTTRSMLAQEPAVLWESDGSGAYSIAAGPEDAARGTRIEIFLKDEAKEFADPDRIKAILRKHSNFISFPIYVGEEKVNTVPALWRESKFSITPEQYKEFYEFLTYDTDEPLLTIHVSVDAPVQFNALLFVPKKPMDLFGMRPEARGLDLYVRRVLIQHETKDLLPEFLGFVRGVVDTEDLPLNISRETLQENLVLRKIQSTITKQVLDRLGQLAKDDAAKYADFWREHGRVMKLGYGDYLHREAFADLVRFESSALSPENGEPAPLTSLADYVSRAKTGQKTIYYLSGPSRAALDLSPTLEIFRDKGLEALYLLEPIDEFVMDSIRSYKELTLASADQADPADLAAFESVAAADAPPPLSDAEQAGLPGLAAAIKAVLGDRVSDVRLSTRLRKSPSCLVSPDGEPSAGMQKIMRMLSKDETPPRKVLELNPDHPLVRNLLRIHQARPDDAFLATAANQLLDAALLLDGYLTDPHQMVDRVTSILTDASGWYADLKK
jgi:molecular chaperone HtpG